MNLISGRNMKIWENDPLLAVGLSISELAEQSMAIGLSWKEQNRMKHLALLEKELRDVKKCKGTQHSSLSALHRWTDVFQSE